VSLEDAREYAKFYGKRLVNEWEWAYAASPEGNAFPWGNTFNGSYVPPKSADREMPAPYDTHAFPQGASSFGVQDLVYNVWEWTNEYVDDHTRAACLVGGSYYRPATSMWYFPQISSLQEHGKYLLMAPSIDRSRGIGFRTAADVAP